MHGPYKVNHSIVKRSVNVTFNFTFRKIRGSLNNYQLIYDIKIQKSTLYLAKFTSENCY